MLLIDSRVKDIEDEIKRKGQEIRRLSDDSVNHHEKLIKMELKQVDLTARVD